MLNKTLYVLSQQHAMNKLIIIILSIIVLSCPITSFAKRVLVEYPDTISVEGVIYKPFYSESFFFHNAYIVAYDCAANKMIWEKKIYSTFLNPLVEHDVQFIMIKKVQYENGILVIENEEDVKYFMNLETLDIKK
jgi:hypothetical protein